MVFALLASCVMVAEKGEIPEGMADPFLGRTDGEEIMHAAAPNTVPCQARKYSRGGLGLGLAGVTEGDANRAGE